MNLNKVLLIGRLGQHPEKKIFDNGNRIAIVNIAVDSPYYSEEEGHWVSNPDWIRCVFSNEIADRAEEKLSKGDEILVEGKLKTRQYEDKEGNKRTINEVKGTFKKNHKKGESESSGSKSQPDKQDNAQQNNTASQAPSMPDEGDDLPF